MSIHPTADEWLLPVAVRVQPKPSEMVAALAAVVKALADVSGKTVSAGVAGVMPAQTDEQSKALAELFASGQKAAVWVGNFAAQHPQAATLRRLAQEIASLSGASFGVIGEAANSVGGHLANAVPGPNGKNVAEMIASPLKAYVLLGIEPSLDCAQGTAATQAIGAADFVVSMTAFDTPELRAISHVMLPVSPFSETSGTFVNAEGRAQSFVAVAKPLGDTRPAWKVLRVLGNLLGLDGFGYNDSEAVRREAIGEASDVAGRLSNELSGMNLSATSVAEGLERVAEVPIYAGDVLVRRAPALQRTTDAKGPALRASAATLASLGIAAGDAVVVKSATGQASLKAELDETVASGCVRVATACESTAALGAPAGAVTVERA